MSSRTARWSFSLLLLVVAACASKASAQLPSPTTGLPIVPANAPQAGSPQVPNAPFTLTPQEEAVLDRVLVDWQNMSAGVKTFEASFTRWDYDGVFGAAGADGSQAPKRVVNGTLRYAAPDKGYYDLSDQSEKWICTGDAVFEFRADLKQVREHPLPPDLRGKAIADGPMPFVFGIEAAKTKARYWMRIITPQDKQGDQVWLEVYPKYGQDAANFLKIDVVLKFEHNNGQVTKLEPFALNMHLPNGKDRTVYQFSNMQTNTIFNGFKNVLDVFVRPGTPFGWQHQVVEAPTGVDPAPTAQQPQQPVQR
jgi:TIGR03009 family protein